MRFFRLPQVLASACLCLCGFVPSHGQSTAPADQPLARTDRNSQIAHEQLLEKARQGRIDVYFVGDSITRRWGATDYPDFLANWKQNFHGWNAANFGWGADHTQHILWRLENGELDGVNPKIIVILAGTNNVGHEPGDDGKVTNITKGIKAIIDLCLKKAPRAAIILMAIFPRNDSLAVSPTINGINDRLAKFADGKRIRFLNINDRLADKNSVLFEGITVDKLHLALKGYQIWADALKPIFREILGPPDSRDQAPPPTGDPSRAAPLSPSLSSPSQPSLRNVFKNSFLVGMYTKYNGRRKPELLGPTTYSLVNYREAETVLADYLRLAKQAEEIYNALPAEQKDAFFQLVLYPVKVCAVLNELYITVVR